MPAGWAWATTRPCGSFDGTYWTDDLQPFVAERARRIGELLADDVRNGRGLGAVVGAVVATGPVVAGAVVAGSVVAGAVVAA